VLVLMNLEWHETTLSIPWGEEVGPKVLMTRNAGQ
jgi:hypothetical protein